MLDNIKDLSSINWLEGILFIVLGMLVWKGLVELKDWFFNKYGIETKKMKKEREDHDMIVANTNAIKELAEIHKRDNDDSNEYSDMIREELATFMTEVRSDVKQFTENRISDRSQSREIQKELTDAIKRLVDSEKTRDAQISALMCGSKELLGNTIDERYKRYIELRGIPQNEVDEFDSIYDAYKKLNGNHGRQTKYEYVKNHLPVIPVKTELVLED